jgi:DNA helicase-2/ATP-dependent DNA helicase PcrA
MGRQAQARNEAVMKGSKLQIELTPERQRLLDSQGHILVLGGPGSGKTTIALMKANADIERGRLDTGQKILFLSFARATIARVEEHAGGLLSAAVRQSVEINTYHGFIWSILRSHGYLLAPSKTISLLPPPEAAARLADISGAHSRKIEKRRLFEEEGLLHFDQFAPICAELLSRSNALRRIICDCYPIIMLDEFQDTNAAEWALIQELIRDSEIVALADPEQRIYEFRGADPQRISDYLTSYTPDQYDFGTENNRSQGTDILTYGNDLLTGKNRSNTYENVSVAGYPFRKGSGVHLHLKAQVLTSRKALCKSENPAWSLAILVPTKSLMLQVSDFLTAEQELSGGKCVPEVTHEVALETAGPSLAAKVIGELLDGSGTAENVTQRLLQGLCEYIRGRKGDKPPTKQDRALTDALLTHIGKRSNIRGKNRQALVKDCERISAARGKLELTGDPAQDWLTVRRLIQTSESPYLVQLAVDAKYLRLMHRGTALRSRLGELWRSTGTYQGSGAAVQEALVQEHFSSSTRTWKGIHVMTMHKAKGKEFTEVIIYEGATKYQDRIVRPGSDSKAVAQSRLLLRVAVTRAMKQVHILTPRTNPCPLL